MNAITEQDKKDIKDMLLKRVQTISKHYNENIKNIIIDIQKNAETFDEEKWISLINKSRTSEPLQTAIAKNPHFKLFGNMLITGKVFKNTRFALLENPNLNAKNVAGILSDIDKATLKHYIDKKRDLKEINPEVWNKIVVDYSTNLSLGKDYDMPLDIVITAYENTSIISTIDAIINSKSLIHKLPPEILTAIANNNNLKEDIRMVAFNIDFIPTKLRYASPKMVDAFYEDAIDTYIELKQKFINDFTVEYSSLTNACSVLMNAILDKTLDEAKEIDMLMRLMASPLYKRKMVDPLIRLLISSSTNETMLDLYTSGMYGNYNEYREIFYNKQEIPENSRNAVALVEWDSLKSTGIDGSGFNFLRKCIQNHVMHPAFYNDISTFKDSGLVEIHFDSDETYNNFVTICEEVVLSPHTSKENLKLFKDFHYGNIQALLKLREEFDKADIKDYSLSQLFKFVGYNGNTTLIFNKDNDCRIEDLKKLDKVFQKAIKELDKSEYETIKKNIVPDSKNALYSFYEDFKEMSKKESKQNPYIGDLYNIVEDFYKKCKSSYDIYINIDEYINTATVVASSMKMRQEENSSITDIKRKENQELDAENR